MGTAKRTFVVIVLHYLRMWDKSVADRVDHFIANSISTQKRIAKFYRSASQVIYPPVDIKKFSIREASGRGAKKTDNAAEKKYFLIVSRLSAYKKIDDAIEAFNKLDWPLYIIGDGEQKEYLKSIAGKNITFLGFVKEDELPGYYQNARALIFPGEDDFGIVPVEAMSAGTPVIALKKGGAKETIIEGVTGDFFEHPVAPLIAEAVVRFVENEKKYNREIIARHAEKFSRDRFEAEIKDFVQKIISEAKQ